MRAPFALAAVLIAAPALAGVDQPRDVVRLQGLDKQTARVSTFDVGVGDTGRFGTLTVTARACYEAPPTEPPESAAFLEIDDLPPGDEELTRTFTGWMFASSPALSALEHAVFDVWVLDCLLAAELVAEAEGGTPDPERAPPRRRPE